MKILGFDLGDGESAVTILDGESTVEPRVMLLDGQMSMLSAVAMREGRIVVGEEASVLSGASDAQVRFKSRYLTDSDAPKAIRAFAQGVMALIMREEPALMAEVSRTVVGRMFPPKREIPSTRPHLSATMTTSARKKTESLPASSSCRFSAATTSRWPPTTTTALARTA